MPAPPVDAAPRACPACGATGHPAPAGASRGYPWARCRSCRSRFVPVDVPEEVLTSFYADYYDEANLVVPDVVYARLTEEVRTFARFRRTGRLLDVGYGAGTLLTAASELGWECWGTEISVSANDAGRNNGCRLFVGDVGDLELPGGSFDVVCMVELLEHVPNPHSQLESAVRLLRPGGLLYATTPNARGISSRLLGTRWSAVAPPEHLQLFGASALRRLALRAGFPEVDVRTQGTNPHEIAAALRGRPLSSGRRVSSAYELNERLQETRRGRMLRTAVNAGLRATGLGDSLRLRAVAPLRPAEDMRPSSRVDSDG